MSRRIELQKKANKEETARLANMRKREETKKFKSKINNEAIRQSLKYYNDTDYND